MCSILQKVFSPLLTVKIKLCFQKLSNVKNLDHDQGQMHNCRKRDSRKLLQRSFRYSIAPVLATCNRMHKRRLSCFESDLGFLRKYQKKTNDTLLTWCHLSVYFVRAFESYDNGHQMFDVHDEFIVYIIIGCN